MLKLLYAVFLLAVIMLSSCDKKNDNPDNIIDIRPGNGVFLLHEGGFNQLNASLGFQNYSTQEPQLNLYQQANGKALGDVFQSMTILGNDGFLVLNNSRTIERIDLKTIDLKSSLSLAHAPRVLLPVSTDRAYISTIFSPWLLVADLDPLNIVDSIYLGHWSEEMLILQDQVWVAASNHDQIYQINPTNHAITDSITVGYGASHLALDMDGRIWVMCIGNFVDIPASIHVVDPVTGSLVKSMVFSQSEFPSKLQIAGDKVFYLNGGLHRLSNQDNTLSVTPFIAGFSYYGYRIDPSDGRIWMADPVDFQQKGKIDVFAPDGLFIRSYSAGIVPSDFRFY